MPRWIHLLLGLMLDSSPEFFLVQAPFPSMTSRSVSQVLKFFVSLTKKKKASCTTTTLQHWLDVVLQILSFFFFSSLTWTMTPMMICWLELLLGQTMWLKKYMEVRWDDMSDLHKTILVCILHIIMGILCISTEQLFQFSYSSSSIIFFQSIRKDRPWQTV